MGVGAARNGLPPSSLTEGKIAEWLKKEGDEVKAGDVVAQVETEKATLDVEAFESGVLLASS